MQEDQQPGLGRKRFIGRRRRIVRSLLLPWGQAENPQDGREREDSSLKKAGAGKEAVKICGGGW